MISKEFKDESPAILFSPSEEFCKASPQYRAEQPDVQMVPVQMVTVTWTPLKAVRFAIKLLALTLLALAKKALPALTRLAFAKKKKLTDENVLVHMNVTGNADATGDNDHVGVCLNTLFASGS